MDSWFFEITRIREIGCKMKKISNLILVGISLFVIIVIDAFACDKYYQTLTLPIKLVISNKGVNRIEFAKHQISQIIVDDNLLDIKLSQQKNHIFLTTKIDSGIIKLSVLDVAGVAIDIELTIAAIKPQAIIIQDKIMADNLQNKKLKLEAELMLKAMMTGKQDKYFVCNNSKNINWPAKKQLRIKQEQLYRFANLVGTKLFIKNTARRKNFFLTKEHLQQLFRDTVAVSISSNIILPKKGVYVWIVSNAE